MNRNATLHGIFDRVPGGRADFAHTKPFTMVPAEDVALLFGVFGVETLRASVVDLAAMRCTHAWQIAEDGALVDYPSETDPESPFPTAMATIIHLNPAAAEKTMVRKVDPLCWAFAWPIEKHHVAVVEARFRLGRGDPSEADAVFVKQACDASMRAASGVGAAADEVEERDEKHVFGPGMDTDANIARVKSPVLLVRTPASAAKPTVESAPTTAAATLGRLARPLAWLQGSPHVITWVLALGLSVAAILFAVLRSDSMLRTDLARLQAQADATMTKAVAKTLREGDYGEVQSELASLAALNYFERALVTNVRGRVIATAGPTQGVRIGDPPSAAIVASARLMPLSDNTGGVGQLLVWDRAAPDAPSRAGRWLLTVVMLIALGAAAFAAALLLNRRRRRNSANR